MARKKTLATIRARSAAPALHSRPKAKAARKFPSVAPSPAPAPRAPRPRPKPALAPESATLDTSEGEKVRTTLALGNKLFVAIKQRARRMDLSFNAVVALALYNFEREQNRLESFGDTRAAQPAPALPPMTFMVNSAPNRADGVRPKMDPLTARFGEGYKINKDPMAGEEDDLFATWEQVELFYNAWMKDPERSWHLVMRDLNMPYEVARACSLAIDSESWADYVKMREELKAKQGG